MPIALKQKYSDYFSEMTDSELFTDDEITERFARDFDLTINHAKRMYVLWWKLTEINN